MKKSIKITITLITSVLLISSLYVAALFALDFFSLKYYSAKKFGVETIQSSMDFNNNGIDDYTDILLGARKDAQNKPKYDSRYWPDAYPPDNIGVCTDVVWRAFKNAGYSLRLMVDRDISLHPELYPIEEGARDSNIDFRRVRNLSVFFSRYAVSLTLDTSDISQWQPGDIVIYGTNHIGIVSDRRNLKGIPYLIHNSGQPIREENSLTHGNITGHYRFDASLLSPDELIAFENK